MKKEKGFIQKTKEMYPLAHLFGCSTSGETCGDRVFDDTLPSRNLFL